MSDQTTPQPNTGADNAQRMLGRGLGFALIVIASAQLLVSLDNTIVNIALPSIKTGFDISQTNLAWVVTAYALPFGGLLLVGGRAGDLFGRRRVFRIGLVLLAIGSALGGAAPNEQVLIAGRVLQGVGSALAAPTALALLATTFPVGPARNKAMGVYGAMGGLGATVGLLLGGLLTAYLHWRWVFFVNVPVVLAVLAGTTMLANGARERGRLDLPGAVTVTLGMSALVYAITRASTYGWTQQTTVGFLAAALILLIIFVTIQMRSRIAMMPIHVIRDGGRAGANVVFLLIGAGMFSTYYFLTLYMQDVKGYSAMETGIAYLPLAFGMAASAAAIGPKLLTRWPPRVVIVVGLALGAAGMAWFGALAPGVPYYQILLPAMLLSGLGLGMAFVSTMIAGVGGVDPQDSGIASGMINTSLQIGGAVGLTSLGMIASAVTEGRVAAHVELDAALTDGYTTAILAGGGLYLAALAVAASTITNRRPPATTGLAG